MSGPHPPSACTQGRLGGWAGLNEADFLPGPGSRWSPGADESNLEAGRGFFPLGNRDLGDGTRRGCSSELGVLEAGKGGGRATSWRHAASSTYLAPGSPGVS